MRTLIFRNNDGDPERLEYLLREPADEYLCLGNLISVSGIRFDKKHDATIQVLEDELHRLKTLCVKTMQSHEYETLMAEHDIIKERLDTLLDSKDNYTTAIESIWERSMNCYQLMRERMNKQPKRYKWLKGNQEKALRTDMDCIQGKRPANRTYASAYVQCLQEIDAKGAEFLWRLPTRIVRNRIAFDNGIMAPRRVKPRNPNDALLVRGTRKKDDAELSAEQVQVFFGQSMQEKMLELMDKQIGADVFFIDGMRSAMVWKPYSIRHGYAEPRTLSAKGPNPQEVPVNGMGGVVVHAGWAHQGFYCIYDWDTERVELHCSPELRSTTQVSRNRILPP